VRDRWTDPPADGRIDAMLKSPVAPAWEHGLAARMAGMDPSAIREILAVANQPGVVSLAGGLPAPELFPVDELGQAFAETFAEQPQQALQYGPSDGYAPLRELLAEWGARRGAAGAPEQILLTSGSQQALDLVARVLIDPGDRVAVEIPTYLGAVQAFNQYQPRYLAVPTDEQGLDVAALERLLTSGPDDRPVKLLYVVPNFQNPSGRTMSLERRQQLAALSNRTGLIVLEDDPYGELRYDGAPLPSVQAFDGRGTVVYAGSFSKVLAPGLRLGWVVAAPGLVRCLLRAKQPADLCTPELTQIAVYRALRKGLLERQVPAWSRPTGRGGTPSSRPRSAPSRPAPGSAGRPGACSPGPSCRRTSTRRRSSRSRSRRRWPTCPGGRSTSTAPAATRCG